MHQGVGVLRNQHFAARRDTGEWLVHLINHEHPARTARADVTLDVDRRPRSVTSISLDDAERNYPRRKERFTLAGGKLTIPVEDIRRHRTVVVRF